MPGAKGRIQNSPPPYSVAVGAGYLSQNFGGENPSFSGPYYQFSLGQSFDLAERHKLFIQGNFRQAFLFTHQNDSRLQLIHLGAEGGYEAWLIPFQLSLRLFAGVGTNVIFSRNVRTNNYSEGMSLENSAALTFSLGGGLSIGQGVVKITGAFQPSLGLKASLTDAQGTTTRIPLTSHGVYLGLGLDLASLLGLENISFRKPDGQLFAKGLRVGAILDSSYTYNFGKPSNGENALRIFDTRNRRPMFNLGQFSLIRETEEKVPFGFGFVLDAGENPNVSAAGSSFSGSFWDIQQLWGEVRLPLGKGVTLRGGKVATIIGNEVIEPVNNQISRSWGFGLAIPFTHGALLANYPLIEEKEKSLKIHFGVANGWDNLYGQNTGVTSLYGIFHQPRPGFNWSVTGALGSKSGTYLSVIDAILKLTAGNFSTVVNLDWGTQGQGGPQSPKANWLVASFNPRWDFNHYLSLSGRGEVFYDPQGVRTDLPQTLGQGALTLHLRPVPPSYFPKFPLELRAEIRRDGSTAKPFLSGSQSVGHQTTFAVSATLHYENFAALGSPEK